MSETKATDKPARKTKSLDQQIEDLRAKLRKAEEAKKAEDAKARERNQRAIVALIRDERLDTVSVDEWRAVMPKLRTLLKVQAEQPPQAAPAATSDQQQPLPVAAAA